MQDQKAMALARRCYEFTDLDGTVSFAYRGMNFLITVR
jgi:hypothetical protein